MGAGASRLGQAQGVLQALQGLWSAAALGRVGVEVSLVNQGLGLKCRVHVGKSPSRRVRPWTPWCHRGGNTGFFLLLLLKQRGRHCAPALMGGHGVSGVHRTDLRTLGGGAYGTCGALGGSGGHRTSRGPQSGLPDWTSTSLVVVGGNGTDHGPQWGCHGPSVGGTEQTSRPLVSGGHRTSGPSVCWSTGQTSRSLVGGHGTSGLSLGGHTAVLGREPPLAHEGGWVVGGDPARTRQNVILLALELCHCSGPQVCVSSRHSTELPFLRPWPCLGEGRGDQPQTVG